MESFGTIQRINDKKTTSRAIISTKENLYKIHYGSAISLSSEILIGSKTAYKHSRKSLKCFIAKVSIAKKLFLILIRNTICQTDTVIRQRKSRDNYIKITLQTKQISLS